MRGLDADATETFASFGREDYRKYGVFLAVSGGGDPAVPVIHKLISDFPGRKIRLLIGDAFPGGNNKVAKLRRLVSEARYDVFAISDSDVRVPRGHLRAISAAFHDPKVGGVTCLYEGLADRQLAAGLEYIRNSSVFFQGLI